MLDEVLAPGRKSTRAWEGKYSGCGVNVLRISRQENVLYLYSDEYKYIFSEYKYIFVEYIFLGWGFQNVLYLYSEKVQVEIRPPPP